MKKFLFTLLFAIAAMAAVARAYTDTYVVTVNGEVVKTATETVDVVWTDNQTFTIYINNFVVGTTPIGNIVVPGITTMDYCGCYEVFSYYTTVTINKGDLNGIWYGPMLGEVPIAVFGKINDAKLYFSIDIELLSLGKMVNVTFGTDSFDHFHGYGGGDPGEFHIRLKETDFFYNGSDICPEWEWDGCYALDFYTVEYSNNLYPGTGTVTVTGCSGEFWHTISANFYIHKGLIKFENHLKVLPSGVYVEGSDIPSPSFWSLPEGSGYFYFSYLRCDEYSSSWAEYTMPTEEGVYSVYVSTSEGEYYQPQHEYLGSYTVSLLNDEEWERVNELYAELVPLGWYSPWRIYDNGRANVSSFWGVKTAGGYVVSLDFAHDGLSGEFPEKILSFPRLESLNLSGNKLSGDAADIYAALQQDSTLFNGISLLNISGNAIGGNVGLLAAGFPNLTKFDASGNCFSTVSPVISATVEDLNLSSQQIPVVLDYGLLSGAAGDSAVQIPDILLYDHASQTFSDELPFVLTTAVPVGFDTGTTSDWYVNMLYQAGEGLVLDSESRNNVYRGANGDVVNAILANGGSVADGSSFGVAFTFEAGNANIADGTDITDLQATVLYMSGLWGNAPFNFTAADICTDSLITAQDVEAVANIILSQPSAAPAGEDVDDPEARVYVKDGKVMLSTSVPVAALSIKATGNIEWNLQQCAMEQAANGANVVAYSLTGAALPMGETVIATSAVDAVLCAAELVDGSASLISVSLCADETASVEYVTIDEAVCEEVYNLAGVRQKGLSRGINLVKSNGKVKKVLNCK